MGLFSNLYDAVELGHFDWPFRNSHPVHPAIVHYPVAFLSTAYSLDALYGLTTASKTSSLLRPLARLTPFLPQLAQLAFASHVIGVISGLPAMTSGTAEFWEMYKKNGINRVDKEAFTDPGKSGQEVLDRSVTYGAIHGVLNTVAFAVSSYAIYARYRVPGFVPGRASILLSGLTLPGVALSAALGGSWCTAKASASRGWATGLMRRRPACKRQRPRRRKLIAAPKSRTKRRWCAHGWLICHNGGTQATREFCDWKSILQPGLAKSGEIYAFGFKPNMASMRSCGRGWTWHQVVVVRST